jgi:hypothetical protein
MGDVLALADDVGHVNYCFDKLDDLLEINVFYIIKIEAKPEYVVSDLLELLRDLAAHNLLKLGQWQQDVGIDGLQLLRPVVLLTQPRGSGSGRVTAVRLLCLGRWVHEVMDQLQNGHELASINVVLSHIYYYIDECPWVLHLDEVLLKLLVGAVGHGHRASVHLRGGQTSPVVLNVFELAG